MPEFVGTLASHFFCMPNFFQRSKFQFISWKKTPKLNVKVEEFKFRQISYPFYIIQPLSVLDSDSDYQLVLGLVQ